VANLNPPPTYDNPIWLDEVTQAPKFSPNWLKWFYDLVQVINSGGGTALNHNSLAGLQGGTTGEYYHTTSAQHSAAFGNKTANTVYAGPTSGADAAPAFRALVPADVPAAVSGVGRVYAARHG